MKTHWRVDFQTRLAKASIFSWLNPTPVLVLDKNTLNTRHGTLSSPTARPSSIIVGWLIVSCFGCKIQSKPNRRFCSCGKSTITHSPVSLIQLGMGKKTRTLMSFNFVGFNWNWHFISRVPLAHQFTRFDAAGIELEVKSLHGKKLCDALNGKSIRNGTKLDSKVLFLCLKFTREIAAKKGEKWEKVKRLVRGKIRGQVKLSRYLRNKNWSWKFQIAFIFDLN